MHPPGRPAKSAANLSHGRARVPAGLRRCIARVTQSLRNLEGGVWCAPTGRFIGPLEHVIGRSRTQRLDCNELPAFLAEVIEEAPHEPRAMLFADARLAALHGNAPTKI